ncbi:MAG: DNA primase [Turicibacter sp.]|nr:DNA primase [Turicibacter sp.]
MDLRQLATEINEKVNIAEVVGRYVQLTRSGRNHKGLCPFHNEATPSFLVSEDKGIYKCFGCGEGGDAISFISKMEGISYSEAMTSLASDAGVDQTVVKRLRRNDQRYNFEKEFEILAFASGFYHYYLLNTEEGRTALAYLAERGLTKETIIQFGIGLAPRDGNLLIQALGSNNHSFEIAKKAGLLQQGESGDYYSPFRSRIMFSVTNERGSVVGFSGRTYLQEDEQGAKYVNSPESPVFQKSHVLYHLHEARKTARTSHRLLLFEGFMDVIAAHRAGFTESIATMGTAMTAEHAQAISRHAKEVILVFDGDGAGLVATAKAIPLLLARQLQVRVARISGGIDPDDYVRQNGAHKFAEIIQGAIGAIEFQYHYLKQDVRLDTTDGQIEFERRLTTFGNGLPDKNMLQAMLRKLRNEIYEQQRGRQSNRNVSQDVGLHRRQNGDANRNGLQVAPRLQVMPNDVKAEKELIYYMSLEKEVFDLVMAHIGTAFNIAAHRKIVQAIESYYFRNNVMDQEEFFKKLDPSLALIAREIVEGLKDRPKNWSRKMIFELMDKVQLGAKKLEHAGKKQMFYNASYDDQLKMLGELTVGQ